MMHFFLSKDHQLEVNVTEDEIILGAPLTQWKLGKASDSGTLNLANSSTYYPLLFKNLEGASWDAMI